MKLIKASIVIALVIGFLLSPQLWVNEGRFFPVITPIDGMNSLSAPFDLFLMSLFVGLSAVWIFYEKRRIGFIALASLIIVIAQDQMRWQPWVYLYVLMLLPYLTQSSKGENKKLILICLQWIIAGVYIWSGIQKMNSNFLDGTFAQMIKASGVGLQFQSWKKVGYAIPFIEFSMGMALLIPAFRKIGMYTAIVTHIVILFCLSPILLNHNSIVYPWNVAMIFFVFLLFWNVKDNPFMAILEIRSNVLLVMLVVLVWVFPILNLFGYWDHFLSFSLYSNKPSTFYIAIEENEIHKIDKRFKHYFAKIPGLQGGQIIEINKWAFSELNVPFYPEMRSFKNLSVNFCDLGIDEDKLVFLEFSYLNGKPNYIKFTCKELKSW
jgi:hypothetical protein